MFTIENLTVRYGDKIVLSNLSLQMKVYKVNGIIGYNGAGKTTLLNSIFGLTVVPRDKILLNGKILKRTQIAYLEASNFFYSNITGRDYLTLFQQKNSNFNLEIWKNIFDIPIDDLIENYSTGMKKKLALLGVLALDKEFLILDEPFNGLDLESLSILRIIIRQLITKGKTILITSHIIEPLTQICDQIFLLKNGKIAKIYTPAEYNTLVSYIHSEADKKYNQIIKQALSIE